VLLINGAAILIRDNRQAFFAALATAAAGFACAGLGWLGWRNGWLDGFGFMVLVGLGLYLPYVAMHTTIFERLLALTGERGNLGFLLYLADAFGYLGYVAVMLARNWWTADGKLLPFFLQLLVAVTVIASLLLGGSWFYFAARIQATRKHWQPAETT
jgi:hypothetical protein